MSAHCISGIVRVQVCPSIKLIMSRWKCRSQLIVAITNLGRMKYKNQENYTLQGASSTQKHCEHSYTDLLYCKIQPVCNKLSVSSTLDQVKVWDILYGDRCHVATETESSAFFFKITRTFSDRILVAWIKPFEDLFSETCWIDTGDIFQVMTICDDKVNMMNESVSLELWTCLLHFRTCNARIIENCRISPSSFLTRMCKLHIGRNVL